MLSHNPDLQSATDLDDGAGWHASGSPEQGRRAGSHYHMCSPELF
jgi:hypothetical protein